MSPGEVVAPTFVNGVYQDPDPEPKRHPTFRRAVTLAGSNCTLDKESNAADVRYSFTCEVQRVSNVRLEEWFEGTESMRNRPSAETPY